MPLLLLLPAPPCSSAPSLLPHPPHSLEAMDPPNLLTGQPGRSDPYLKLKLGKTKINTRSVVVVVVVVLVVVVVVVVVGGGGDSGGSSSSRRRRRE